jgi:hypothetical protein
VAARLFPVIGRGVGRPAAAAQGDGPATERISTAATLATARLRMQRKTMRSITDPDSVGERLLVTTAAPFAALRTRASSTDRYVLRTPRPTHPCAKSLSPCRRGRGPSLRDGRVRGLLTTRLLTALFLAAPRAPHLPAPTARGRPVRSLCDRTSGACREVPGRVAPLPQGERRKDDALWCSGECRDGARHGRRWSTTPQQMVHFSPDMMVSRDTSAPLPQPGRGFRCVLAAPTPPCRPPEMCHDGPRQISHPALRRRHCIRRHPAL